MILILIAALSWGGSNLLIKKAGNVNVIALMIWVNLILSPLLLGSSFALEETGAIFEALEKATLISYGIVAFSSVFSGIMCYSLWAYLLRKYPTTLVAPFSMLVPVFAILLSTCFMGEHFSNELGIGSAFVLLGLLVIQGVINPKAFVSYSLRLSKKVA